MRTFIAAITILSIFALVAAGATINVTPNPGPGEISLAAALEIAQPGDEIVLSAGSYSGAFTIDKSVEIRGETGAEVTAAEDYKAAFRITGGRVTITGLAVNGPGTGIEVTGPADLAVDQCRFSGLKTGVHLADGRGKITGCSFDSCEEGIVAGARLQVAGCGFTENGVGLAAHSGASVQINDCQFTSSERAITGETPCHVDGTGNRFSDNGLDLIGDVSPYLRPHGTGAKMTARYPSPAYPSLQAAVDALQSGGKLIITEPFAESAVIDRSLSILPAGPDPVAISGRPTDAQTLPALSIVGDVQVDIERLQVYGGIVVGPKAKLSLTKVSIVDQSLELTGKSELIWSGGSGELHVAREATATLDGVSLSGAPGLQVKGLGRVNLTHCIIDSPRLKTAASVGGLGQLTIERSFLVGTLTLNDRAQVRVSDSSIGGFARLNGDLPSFAIELAGPADLTLDGVEVSNTEVGIYFAASGHVALSAVRIHGTHVGMGIENRVSEFDFPFGLWTPKVTPTVVVEGPGVTMSNNDVDFAPAVTQEPWPVGFYEEVYGDQDPDTATVQALDDVTRAGKSITSCHLRVHDDYSWRDKDEEIYYVRPDKLRIDIYESDKLVQTLINDGHTLWDHDIFGKSVTKLDLDSLKKEHPDTWRQLLTERTRFDPAFADLYLPSAVYLGTEQVGGEDTYVFSGLPIRGANCDAVKMKIWISPRDGLWRKVEYYSTKGKTFLTKTVTQLELNPAVPAGKIQAGVLGASRYCLGTIMVLC